MRLDRRTLVESLERLGQAPVPPASPGFAVRTEERLRSMKPVALVEDAEPVALRSRRPVPWLPGLAVAAVIIAVLTIAPKDEHRQVSVISDRSSTTTSTTTTTTPPTTPPTAARAATTTTTTAPVMKPVPVTPIKAPTTTAPKERPVPVTTTVPERPAPTTTTVVSVEPTSPPVTTTLPPPVAKVDLRCVAGTREGAPLVNCTWSGAADAPVATWRVYRAAGTEAKRLVWTASEPATSSYDDREVAVGTVYHYAVEGVDAGGRTVAKSVIVEVSCCPI